MILTYKEHRKSVRLKSALRIWKEHLNHPNQIRFDLCFIFTGRKEVSVPLNACHSSKNVAAAFQKSALLHFASLGSKLQQRIGF